MRSQPNKTRKALPRLIAPLAVVAAALTCLALSPRTLNAGDDGPMTVGGGDAIGSLPFNSQPPPEGSGGGPTPSIVLQGPNLDAIQAVVLDAWGDGYAEYTYLGEAAGVRVELQGHVSLIVDRNLLQSTEVTFGLDVSQGFSGGLGMLTKDHQLVGSQILPVSSDLELPLRVLSATGALDTGGLTLHSINTIKRHHALELSGSGGTLRLVTHE